MEQITPVAGALSTYGLYAICAMLLIAVIYLFKQQREMEEEMREKLLDYAAKTSQTLERSIETIKANTETIKEFQNTLSELKQTVQLSAERHK